MPFSLFPTTTKCHVRNKRYVNEVHIGRRDLNEEQPKNQHLNYLNSSNIYFVVMSRVFFEGFFEYGRCSHLENDALR